MISGCGLRDVVVCLATEELSRPNLSTAGWMIVDIPRAFEAMGVDFYGRARRIALARREA